MKISIIIENIKRLTNWLSKSPEDAEYNRLLKEFKGKLLELKMKALNIEFNSEASIKHDGENIFRFEDTIIYDENIFDIDDETYYVLTEDEFKDFTTEQLDIINHGGYKFSFEDYITSKDKQLIMYKDCCLNLRQPKN